MRYRLGNLIRQIREEKKISRQTLCQDESVLTVRQLQRIENGECYPSVPTLVYLIEKLDTKMAILFDEE